MAKYFWSILNSPNMIFNNFLEAKQFYLVFLQYMKATKRTVLKKKCYKVYFCLGIWGVLQKNTTSLEKSCSVENKGTLEKLVILLNMSLCLALLGVPDFNREDNLGVPLQNYLFPWDSVVSICHICFLPEKMIAFLSFLLKILSSMNWQAVNS